MKVCKVCNENLVKDEYHTYHMLMYKVIREKYGDLLDGHDNVSAILQCPPRRVSTYVHALFSHRDFYYKVVTPILRKETHTRRCVDLIL